VKGGNGGDGMIAFTSLFAKEFAGLDGDGGNDGHVIFRANKDIKSLSHVKKSYNGENVMSCSMIGKSGEHLFVDVPVGTFIKTPPVFSNDINPKDVTIATKTIANLDEHGCMYLAAKGGTGGKGMSMDI
jgi:GTP-binding protein